VTARALIAGCGLAALALPGPSLDPVGVVLVLTGLVALFVAVQQPGSGAPLLVIGVAALSWLAVGGDAGTARLVALAACASVVHAAAAFAAVVPPRTPVAAPVVRRWVLRTAATTAAGIAVIGASTIVPAPTAPVTTVVAGLLAALLLGGWALLPRRRCPGPGRARATRPAGWPSQQGPGRRG